MSTSGIAIFSIILISSSALSKNYWFSSWWQSNLLHDCEYL